MIMNYRDCIDKYGNDRALKKALGVGTVYKLEKGIYSDRPYEPEYLVISRKYPYCVFTLNSALYYQDLTDVIPEKYYLATDKNSAKIRDQRVRQVFDNSGNYLLGAEMMAIDDGEQVLMYNKERLLIEVIRSASKLPFDYYKEIISNYRSIIYRMNTQLLQDYIEMLPKSALVAEVLRKEIF